MGKLVVEEKGLITHQVSTWKVHDGTASKVQ